MTGPWRAVRAHVRRLARSERGAAVVRAAMTTVRQILATDTALGAAATRAGLPVLAAVAALGRSTRR